MCTHSEPPRFFRVNPHNPVGGEDLNRQLFPEDRNSESKDDGGGSPASSCAACAVPPSDSNGDGKSPAFERRAVSATPVPNFFSIPRDVKIVGCKAYRNGQIFGMDLSSAFAVLALDLQPSDQVLDLCCAPGGKLCYIADLLGRTAGGFVTGVDVSENRLNIAKAAVRKYNIPNVRVFACDGTTFAEPPEPIPSNAASSWREAPKPSPQKHSPNSRTSSDETSSSGASCSGQPNSHSSSDMSSPNVEQKLSSSTSFTCSQTSQQIQSPPDPSHSRSSASANETTRSPPISSNSEVLSQTQSHSHTSSRTGCIVPFGPFVGIHESCLKNRARKRKMRKDAKQAQKKRKRLAAVAEGEEPVPGGGKPVAQGGKSVVEGHTPEADGGEPEADGSEHAAEGKSVGNPSIPSDCSPPRRLYDKVLVDAECSHDASDRHVTKFEKKSAESFSDSAMNSKRLDNLEILQRGLIENGYRMLEPGGTLVYATCSFRQRQNEDIVSWLLDREPNAELVPMDSPFFSALSPRPSKVLPGAIQFDQEHTRTSGLFIAKLRKRRNDGNRVG